MTFSTSIGTKIKKQEKSFPSSPEQTKEERNSSDYFGHFSPIQ